MNDLKFCFSHSYLTDFEIRTTSNSIFCHKLVLKKSPYFSNLLQQNENIDHCDLLQFEFEFLNYIIRFFYNFKIPEKIQKNNKFIEILNFLDYNHDKTIGNQENHPESIENSYINKSTNTSLEEEYYDYSDNSADDISKKKYPKYSKLRKLIQTPKRRESNEINIGLVFKSFEEMKLFVFKKSYFLKKKMKVKIKNKRIYCIRCNIEACSGLIKCKKFLKKWILTNYQKHSCDSVSFYIPTVVVESFIKTELFCINDKKTPTKLIKQKFPTISNRRISRIFSKIHKIHDEEFHAKKTISLCSKIKEHGGDYEIQLNENRKIISIAFITELCTQILKDETFFGTIIADSTFLNGSLGGILLLVTYKLPNGLVCPLGGCWCFSENIASWDLFLKLLKKNIVRKITLISDQGGAMLASFQKNFPNYNYQTCLWHLSQKVPINIKNEFWNCIFSVSNDDFERNWNCLKNKNKIYTETKLSDFKQNLNLFSKNKRLGSISSQLIESVNSLIKIDLNTQVDDVFKDIVYMQYSSIIKLLNKNEDLILFDKSKEILENEIKLSENLIIKKHLSTCFYTLIDNNITHSVYQICSETLDCSCNFYFNFGIPCQHLIKALLFEKKNFDFILSIIHPFHQIKNYNMIRKSMDNIPDLSNLMDYSNYVEFEKKNKKKRKKKRNRSNGFL